MYSLFFVNCKNEIILQHIFFILILMFLLPENLVELIVDYAIPLIVELRPECSNIPLHSILHHPMAFFYLTHHQLPLSLLSPSMLSEQTNEEIVAYMMEHPELIDMNVGSKNPHPKIVNYMIKTFDFSKFHWMFLSQNTNNDVVRYLLTRPRMINWREFSKNQNELVVTYLLDHTHHIFWESFSQNTNEKAINYLLDHPEYIVWKHFCKHNNDRVVSYLLHHTSLLHNLVYHVSENTHDDIVLYLLKHTIMNYQSFSRNTNSHAVKWLIKHIDMMPIEIYKHPDVRIFTKLLSIKSINRSLLLDNPNVFYYTKNKIEYEWYVTQLL
jgi:hypothetical protein